MKMSGHLYVLAALPPGNDPTVPIGSDGGWAPESVWTQWRGEKSLLLPGIKITVVQPVV